MKIAILGHKGMLGRTAKKYFSLNSRYQISTVDVEYSLQTRQKFIEKLQYNNPDIIINALGKIKQKNPSTYSMYLANSYLPNFIAENIDKNQVLIHPSTDCVFSGAKRGGYSLNDFPDPLDDYGLSKLQAENISKQANCLVVRTSVIGIEENSSYGLLSWFLNRNCETRGFENHIWSGITTLEWCKSIEALLEKNERGLHHISSESISKMDLLLLFRNVFKKDISIIGSKDSLDIDRTLLDSSIKVCNIKDQLIELKNFYSI